MFEFDAGKLIIIGIVALVVIGPKELPRVLRQVGHAVAKLRRMAAEFQAQFMDAMREAELADLEAEAAKLAASAKIGPVVDPVKALERDVTRAIEGSSENVTATMPEPVPAEPSAEPRPSISAASGEVHPAPGVDSTIEIPSPVRGDAVEPAPKAEAAQDATPHTV